MATLNAVSYGNLIGLLLYPISDISSLSVEMFKQSLNDFICFNVQQSIRTTVITLFSGEGRNRTHAYTAHGRIALSN